MSRWSALRRGARAGVVATAAGAAVVLALASPAVAAGSLPAVDLTPSWADGSSATMVNDVGQAIVVRGSDSADFLRTGGSLTQLTYQGLPIQAAALNDLGQVVGTVQTASGGSLAVRWAGGQATALPVPGGAIGMDINDRGQIVAVGISYASSPPSIRGYLIDRGTVRDLGVGLSAVDLFLKLNQLGQVAGNEVIGSGGPVYGTATGFVWSGGHVTHLPTLGGDVGVVADFNNLGQAVGRSSLANGEQHPVLWSAGAITDLGTLGDNSFDPTAINDLGQVVGRAESPTGSSQAAIWSGGHLRSLGIPGESRPVGINDLGQVLAEAPAAPAGTPGRTVDQGYVWQNGTLTALGSSPVKPFAINDLGLAVGAAQFASGAFHAASWNAGTIR